MKKYLLIISILISSALYSQTGITTSATIISDGTTRNYSIYVPAMYNGSVPVPLVFNIHGYAGSDTQQEQYADFRQIADTANFIMVLPLALGVIPSWDVFGTIASGAADKNFLMSLLDTIKAHYNINSARVYSTGYSEGGFMSQDLACLYSQHFAAVASVCGGMVQAHYAACNPQHPTPFMEIHGTLDNIISYYGTGGVQTCLPTDTVVKYWVNFDACNTPGTLYNLPDINITDGSTVEHYVYTSSNINGTVELYKVINGGHQWPSEVITGGLTGTGFRNMDFSASKEIWRFFSQHVLITGIENYEAKNNSFFIYPNPSNGVFTIQMDNGNLSSDNYQLSIYNALGEIILKEKLLNNSKNIDLRDVPEGIYFYQATYKSEIIKSGKLIIQ